MINYMKNLGLRSQLVIITVLTIIFSSFTLLMIIPNLLIPFYENNIYEMLKQPLPFIEPGSDNSTENIAYIIKTNKTMISNNFYDVMKTKDYSLVMKKASKDYGKFKLNNSVYYYNTSSIKGLEITTLTNNNYILSQQKNLNGIVFPITFFILIITVSILIFYSDFLVRKISKIKKKIDNIDNNNFNHNEKFIVNDELSSLNKSIEKTRLELIKKEEYKNNMFQSISHELKTPIMVISSHVEAADDKIISKTDAMKVIKDEVDNLNKQVELILELNKINYLKTKDNRAFLFIDIDKVIKDSIKKLKVIRKDCIWNYSTDNSLFKGDNDSWQIIIDNILNNFTRFASSKIDIIIKDNKISLYNDGPLIESNLINDVFDPFKKGSKGKHGLGLSIAKESLNLFGYKIVAKNIETVENKGVLFLIE